MPGIVVGEIDEDIISVNLEDGKFKGFQGQVFSDYYEPIDDNRSIASIKEIFCAEDDYEFYKKIFKYRDFFANEIVEHLGIKSLEEIFFTQFETHGFKKMGNSNKTTSDGYDETYVVFENNEGIEIEVFYPEYDYSEDSSIIRLDQDISIDWLDFLETVDSGNVMNYKGVTIKE